MILFQFYYIKFIRICLPGDTHMSINSIGTLHICSLIFENSHFPFIIPIFFQQNSLRYQAFFNIEYLLIH